MCLVAILLPVILLGLDAAGPVQALALGALGGTVSALLKPGTQASAGPRVLMRPAVGALAGFLAYLGIRIGIIQPGPGMAEALGLLAFLAGFLERLVSRQGS